MKLVDSTGLAPPGVVIVIGGGVLIYGGYKAGSVITQKVYDGYCLVSDLLNSEQRRKEMDILENACAHGITGACELLAKGAVENNASLRENVRQGGNISNFPAGAGSEATVVDMGKLAVDPIKQALTPVK